MSSFSVLKWVPLMSFAYRCTDPGLGGRTEGIRTIPNRMTVFESLGYAKVFPTLAPHTHGSSCLELELSSLARESPFPTGHLRPPYQSRLLAPLLSPVTKPSLLPS